MADIVSTTLDSNPELDFASAFEGELTQPVSDSSLTTPAILAVNTDQTLKIPRDSLGIAVPIEIRPTLRNLPNETPFTIEMINANLQPYAIQLPDGTIITDLKLTPNPDTMTINSAKMINRYNTMTRWVEEHWGDEIDTVSFSGSSFSFTAYNLPDAPDTGLSIKYRDNTAAFKLFKSLVTFFRYNGCIYKDPVFYEYQVGVNLPNELLDNSVAEFLKDNPSFMMNHPRRGMIDERLYVKIRFDYVEFLGYFDSLDLIEEAATPYRFTYSAVFKSEKTKFLIG